MKGKYIIKIVPLVRLPIARTQVFSYWFPAPIARGSLVEIPFYNRVIFGIVMESRDDFPREGNFQIKKAKRTLEVAILSEKQIQFARNLADYYLSPLGIVLKFMIPKVVKVKKKKREQLAQKFEIIKKNKLAEEALKIAEKEIAIAGPKSERDRIIFSIMKQTLQKNKQCLHLSPEIFPAVLFFERLKSFFPADKIALIHGNVSKGEIYEAWGKIKSGRVKIIVTSKIGVFLPFRDLGAVIIEESGDISHKQWDMNPRYNAARAAQVLADIHEAKIIHSNSLLSVELWKKAKEKNIKLIDLGANEKITVKVANIFEERKSADFPIGKELYKSLSSVLNKKEKALLIVNRKGFSSYSICRNCKSVLRCPNCERALVYFEEKERYNCLHCSHKIDLLSACPACGACQFSHQGAGIQLVEKKIRRLFPSARILRLDADVSKSKKRNKRIFEDLESGNFDILTGTQIALKIGGIQKFNLVAFPSFEDLGSIPDFNTRELVFAMLNQASGLAGSEGVVFIQTSYPDDFLLVAFQDRENETFFEKEMRERKKTASPPFSQLVKFFYRDISKKKVDAETKKVFDLLRTLSDSSIDISEPYKPFVEKKRGYYCKNILIKTKPDTDIRQLPIFSVLGGLRKGWAVDVEPVSTV